MAVAVAVAVAFIDGGELRIMAVVKMYCKMPPRPTPGVHGLCGPPRQGVPLNPAPLPAPPPCPPSQVSMAFAKQMGKMSPADAVVGWLDDAGASNVGPYFVGVGRGGGSCGGWTWELPTWARTL